MNEGTLDRVVRVIVGIVLVLVASLVLQGAGQIVLWVIGGILLVTGISGVCLLYLPFRFSTRK
jgi:hypothetical protein